MVFWQIQINVPKLLNHISAIRAVLREDGFELNENKFLLNALTRACKPKNDRVRTRLPICKGVLETVIRKVKSFFAGAGQTYLEVLYVAILTTAYYGLFRVGELSDSPHAIKVADVHIGQNKKKLLFILRTSKTHGRNSKPQMVKISSTRKPTLCSKKQLEKGCKLVTTCPYNALRNYIKMRPRFNNKCENFFVFQDRSPVKTKQMRKTLKQMLKLAGFEDIHYNFHSIRIGRSVDLMKMNLDVGLIQKLGCWSSNCVYTYLKNQ